MPLEPSPEPVWIVGPVTRDEVDGRLIPGGASLYVARACEAVGVTASVLYAAAEDIDASTLAPHESLRIAASTLTLRHEFVEGRRQQSLLQPSGRTITPDDVPPDWPEPATLILGPLLPEDIDVLTFVDDYPSAEVALLAQGLQRSVLPDGRIANRAQPSSMLLDVARPNVSIFLSQREVALWPAGAVEHLAARAARVVVTHGEQGATIFDRHGARHIEAMPAQPVDTTGAGDVFAAAFILAVRAGEEFAGQLAAACAAAAVEVRGPGRLPSLTEIQQRAATRADRAADGGSAA